jgi:hypothetical protein
MVGMARKLKRIMTCSALKKGKTLAARQDSSREFISLLVYICADGTSILPALIYKGAANELQDSWVEDVKADDSGYFTASSLCGPVPQVGRKTAPDRSSFPYRLAARSWGGRRYTVDVQIYIRCSFTAISFSSCQVSDYMYEDRPRGGVWSRCCPSI